MRIAVVGSGAMGSLYGGLLADAGEDVTLIDIWKEHVDAINTRGLKISGASGERLVRVRATTNPAEVGTVDLIMIFVKAYDTKKAAQDALPMVGPETVFLTLQNGLGNVEQIEEVAGKGRVVAGATTHGSTLVGPGEVFHAGKGLTYIGELTGEITERVKRIAETFNRAGIETHISQNIQGIIWKKILINVGINAITAITGLRNGEILLVPEVKEIVRKAVLEAAEVAKAAGITVEMEDPVAEVYKVAELTAKNKSSMLQDVERGRRTEIDAINGAIVRIGKQYGVDTPVNETLVAAVKGIEYASKRS
ncbi:MAG TPA: 2-dehydropantoate 2-reductase [Candidatus Bathyarchaeota archaeon]|nr:2-dehydropantoate 2-reductase [Candidatus Bathyarchaeota archaeon]